MSTTKTYFGISGRLASHDAYYRDTVVNATAIGVRPPMTVDELVKNKTDVNAIADAITMLTQNRIIGDKLNNSPICDVSCEHPLVGRYNLGKKCPCCGFVVTENRIAPDLFLKAPTAVGKFVNPRFWAMFNNFFGGLRLDKFNRKKLVVDRGFDLMLWMLDKYYRTNETIPPRARATIRVLEENNFQRGIHNLIDKSSHWFSVLTQEENFNLIFNPSKGQGQECRLQRKQWERFFKTQHQFIFSTYLPVLPSIMIVSEENERGTSFDPVFGAAIDAVKNLAMLLSRKTPTDDRFFITRVLKVNRELTQFYCDFRKEYLSGKRGAYRGKVNSTHSSYSGRATITPQSGVHDAWKLKAPWRWAVGLMMVQIESKLLARGYTPKECTEITAFAAMQYHPLVAEIFDELIRESRGGYGIAVIVLRNPTLVQLSVQLLFIDEIVTDVDQCSLRISNRVIKMANADFDGDQFQVQLVTDETIYQLGLPLKPDQGFLSPRNVDEVESGEVLHNELISMQHEFLIENEEDDREGISLEEAIRRAEERGKLEAEEERKLAERSAKYYGHVENGELCVE